MSFKRRRAKFYYPSAAPKAVNEFRSDKRADFGTMPARSSYYEEDVCDVNAPDQTKDIFLFFPSRVNFLCSFPQVAHLIE